MKKQFVFLIGLSAFLALTGRPWASSEPNNKEMETMKATFAGGCFWCIEAPFDKVPGVTKVTSGYMGGHKTNPTYEEVSTGETGHLESVQVEYDPTQVSYEKLLEVFWRQIDPTDAGGQFADRGSQYHTAIFYHDENQKKLAELSKKNLDASGIFQKPIVTVIRPAETFYSAEAYHQKYYKTCSVRYKMYRMGSGRDSFIEKMWGKDADAKLAAMKTPATPSNGKSNVEGNKMKLTPLQKHVTQECGTEPPFQNAYWNNHKPGIYVDVVSGEALFASTDKFDSGTGWPSFTKPLEKDNVVEKEDNSLMMSRTEVKSKHANSHLGHVFPDGPGPTGLRYCINSASLRFIPAEDLEKEGYGQYKKLFN